jgi:PAP2 superfamily
MRASWVALVALGGALSVSVARASGPELPLHADSLGVRDSAAVDSSAFSAPADSVGSMGAPESATTGLGATEAAPDSTKGHPKRRSLGDRGVHTVKAFVSDVGYVVTSPFRLKPSGLLLTVAGIGTTVLTYSYDDEIQRGFQRSRGNSAYDHAIDLGDTFVDVGFMPNVLPYEIGGAALGTVFDIDPLQSVCLDLIESHMIAGGSRNIAKFVIGRKHPFEGGRSEFLKHGTSAPSGHTSVVFEMATILTRHTAGWPTVGRIAVGVTTFGIATAVAMQRVDTNAHWASDCVAAVFQGVGVANTVVTRNQKRREKEGIAYRPILVPSFGPEGQPAFALRWDF